MDAAELRQLVRHKQAVAIIDTAAPIKFSYPPFIQAAPEALSNATNKGTPRVRSFKDAETNGNRPVENPLESEDLRPNGGASTNTARQLASPLTYPVPPGRAEDDSPDSAFEQQSMRG